MSGESWSDRLFGGFRKTSEKLTENLAGIVSRTRLDEAQLDEIEDALILSDLGPRAAARI
ncbi:MAG: signal recognition particle-docking protein FtsY, partial [Sphingomonadaceae bacterium]|nr:signal recognition particle-docking protein FtsY [Sphingomonadaceae bacterium]